jgi:magnesium transporter
MTERSSGVDATTPGVKPGRPSRKVGMLPGTLVHVGRRLAESVRVDVYHFEGDGPLEQRPLMTIDELSTYRKRGGVTWLDVNGIHDVEVVGKIGAVFGLHPLLLEDIVNAHQRPKFETYGENLFLVLKMLQLDPVEDRVEAEQVSLVLGPGYVLTFQEQQRDTFDPVRRRLAEPGTRVRQQGADFLAYALIDTIVDNYFAVLERLGDRIEGLEDDIIEEPDRVVLERLYGLKQGLADLRRLIWPLRDALAAMSRGDTPLIQPGTLPYLRDVQDHTLRVIDAIETYRDTTTTMVDMYMSSVSNRLNETMRVLTVISTIFIPLTFIVGIYGMNFPNMPEMGWRWSYAVVWGVMLAASGGMIVYFRRRGWF